MFERQDIMMQAMLTMMTKMPAPIAQAAAPPIITVVPTQTDAKKGALLKVQAILQLFEPAKRALAWRVSEYGPSNEILSYDMERATDRVRDIFVLRGGRFAEMPSKTFLSNCSLLLFDYAGEGLSLENFNADKAKIGENWDRFTRAYMHMSHVLREYVNANLGAALDSLYINLLNIHTMLPRMKTSALLYVTQQLLGRLRTMEQMHSSEDVQMEVVDILRLVEGSPGFQQLINRELMGMEVETGKRSRDSDSTPPEPKKVKQGMKPTRPTLQGAYPCYSWIKQANCCKGTTCNAPKKKGVHPHKFDPIDRGAAEKNFREWVEKYT
jgi:hypothetical protein